MSLAAVARQPITPRQRPFAAILHRAARRISHHRQRCRAEKEGPPAGSGRPAGAWAVLRDHLPKGDRRVEQA
jgi:hypothetical protein